MENVIELKCMKEEMGIEVEDRFFDGTIDETSFEGLEKLIRMPDALDRFIDTNMREAIDSAIEERSEDIDLSPDNIKHLEGVALDLRTRIKEDIISFISPDFEGPKPDIREAGYLIRHLVYKGIDKAILELPVSVKGARGGVYITFSKETQILLSRKRSSLFFRTYIADFIPFVIDMKNGLRELTVDGRSEFISPNDLELLKRTLAEGSLVDEIIQTVDMMDGLTEEEKSPITLIAVDFVIRKLIAGRAATVLRELDERGALKDTKTILKAC